MIARVVEQPGAVSSTKEKHRESSIPESRVMATLTVEVAGRPARLPDGEFMSAEKFARRYAC